MADKTPVVLIPGLLCNEILWSHQLSSLGDVAQIQIADTTIDDNVEDMAARLLEVAPPICLGRVLPGRLCGHLAPMERPYALSALLRYWLDAPAQSSHKHGNSGTIGDSDVPIPR